MNADLTVNTPWKVLLKYVLPLFGGAVFQQLYTLADTIIAGRFAGQTALAAIGASNSIVNILMAFALGANAGCAVLAARYFGQKDNAKVKTTIYTALIAFAVFCAVLLVAGVLTCRVTLYALKTPGEAMNESVTYLNIYYFGLPSLMLYNLGTGIFSALGDSKTPFLFLVFSSVTNIVLDYYMVQPWGVAGVSDIYCAGCCLYSYPYFCVFAGAEAHGGKERRGTGFFGNDLEISYFVVASGHFAEQFCFRGKSFHSDSHQRTGAGAGDRNNIRVCGRI